LRDFFIMKKQLLALSLLATCAGTAVASNVTVYGLIDVGLTHYSNVLTPNGQQASLTRMDNGVAQGSRLGFKGTEDLGGGLTALFTIENGFNVDDGSQAQGLLFGRQSFVGLSHVDYGTLTFGRQYDFMFNMGPYSIGAATVAGGLAWGLHADSATAAPGIGQLSDRVIGDRINNAVKYESKKYNGFSFGAMYGFGEVAGNSAAGRAISAIATYNGGPFGSSLAYTEVKNATGTGAVRIYALGANYQVNSKLKPFALVTQAKDTLTSRKLTTYEVGTNYNLTPSLILAGGYTYQQRNQGVAKAQQFNLSLDYVLSKRTDVYTAVSYINDKGYNAAGVGGGGPKADGHNQTALRVGIRHRF
jgi:predicted porin